MADFPLSARPQDARSRRTRLALRRALVELVREHGYANVSVQALTARAGVHRTTFYRHHQDKYDVVQDVLNDLSAALEAAHARLRGPVRSRAWLDPAVDPPELTLVFLAHVEENADFYRLMLGANGMPAFFLELHQRLEDFLERLLPQHLLTSTPALVPPTLCAPVLASMGLSIVLWWLRSGLQPDRVQVARWLVRLEVVGLFGGALPDAPPAGPERST
ncbi:TetR/AcrR family transcriptional regulator [Deinococcus maricopensis]|uniref:Regulatory protein TetR n=1 Tax=Deinococcus maricopensis (strain DSM 21211 / LMG 22137 / NRRL B-23946 / LB-34) TaxID=709986 RepID=E8U395_DEIML|nr:TetR/AcrR family transcriptional regulator [Deinococcus maricopensis]ADV66040.1 regulatory protein TetR [Deinococcus maricopensis DSM 21211]